VLEYIDIYLKIKNEMKDYDLIYEMKDYDLIYEKKKKMV